MMSLLSTARRNATSCASGAIGKLDEVDGGGAISGKSRFSHCFFSLCGMQRSGQLFCRQIFRAEAKVFQVAHGEDLSTRFLMTVGRPQLSAFEEWQGYPMSQKDKYLGIEDAGCVSEVVWVQELSLARRRSSRRAMSRKARTAAEGTASSQRCLAATRPSPP